ncbi:MAG: hypothetical protein RMM17_03190 [Acidobacteriota bacterium]|nr:hypothetical protein [Blastocatellia bacterium]MDW8411674.1 hypothetical protein [Acidobacteriota bacterium]
MGGLARRARYVEAFREKFKDIATLHVDIGHIFQEDFSVPLREDFEVMNKWVLKGFSRFKLDAVNLSHHDLAYCTYAFGAAFKQLSQETPVIENLITANAAPSTPDKTVATPKPYLISEVTLPRLNRRLKVGFIGLTEEPISSNPNRAFVVVDPIQQLKQVLPQVRAKSDLVVVLAYVKPDVAKQLAQQNAGIDVILAANHLAQPPDASREGKTIIAYAWQQTKSIGELRLYLDSSGKVVDYMNRYLVLDKSIPDEPEAAKLVLQAKAAIDEAKSHMDKKANTTSIARPGF